MEEILMGCMTSLFQACHWADLNRERTLLPPELSWGAPATWLASQGLVDRTVFRFTEVLFPACSGSWARQVCSRDGAHVRRWLQRFPRHLYWEYQWTLKPENSGKHVFVKTTDTRREEEVESDGKSPRRPGMILVFSTHQGTCARWL